MICDYKIADLSILDDIHRVAQELKDLDTPIDVLIHNAGVYLTTKEMTADGLEKVLVVHYLSSFIINYALIPKLKSQGNARIILVNSEGHRFAAWGLKLDDMNWEKRRYTGLQNLYSAWQTQGYLSDESSFEQVRLSSLGYLMCDSLIDDIFKNTGVTINAVHPGAVKTETGQENGPIYKWFKKNFFDKTLKTPEISAEALYYLGAAQELKNVSAKFYNLTTEEEPTPPALDMEEAYKLWEASLNLSKLKPTQTGREKENIEEISNGYGCK